MYMAYTSFFSRVPSFCWTTFARECRQQANLMVRFHWYLSNSSIRGGISSPEQSSWLSEGICIPVDIHICLNSWEIILTNYIEAFFILENSRHRYKRVILSMASIYWFLLRDVYCIISREENVIYPMFMP